MVSAHALQLRLTLAGVPAHRGLELEAAIEALGVIALKGRLVTADARHCNRRTVAAINAGGATGALRSKQAGGCIVSDARARFGAEPDTLPSPLSEDAGHGRTET